MSAIDELNEEIKSSMKSRDSQRLSVVRMLKSKIMNVNARGEVSDDEAAKIFKTYAKGLKEAISLASQHGKEDVVTETSAELEIVKEFLPAELNPEKVEEIVKQVIVDNDLSGMGAMGQAMSKSMAALQGQADGNLVKEIASKLLQG